ncbi:MAG: hypothetical protein LBB11_01050 [Puniceicoccales bacterium]|jgi:hypothetical protein|nr:hypothetical protein [Puniceicoccales bacterium]
MLRSNINRKNISYWITIFSSFAVSAVSEVQVTQEGGVQSIIAMFEDKLKSQTDKDTEPMDRKIPPYQSQSLNEDIQKKSHPKSEEVQELGKSSAIKQEEKPSSSPNDFYKKITRNINNNISGNTFQEIGTQKNNHDDDHDYLVLLAKINSFCNFDKKVKLYHYTFCAGKSRHEFLDNIIKTTNEPLIMIKLNVSKGIAGFLPYFFEDLTIFERRHSDQEKNPWTISENYCPPSTSKIKLKDDNIKTALASQDLGKEGKWKNGNAIYISDWQNCWRKKEVLFFVCYDEKLFIVIPTEEPNEKLNSIDNSHWHSSFKKTLKKTR